MAGVTEECADQSARWDWSVEILMRVSSEVEGRRQRGQVQVKWKAERSFSWRVEWGSRGLVSVEVSGMAKGGGWGKGDLALYRIW